MKTTVIEGTSGPIRADGHGCPRSHSVDPRCGCDLEALSNGDLKTEARDIPSRDEVMIQSSWNPTQQIGSSPTILDWEVLVSCDRSVWNVPTHHDGWQERSA